MNNLSVCMIVRDEAATIKRAIESVSLCADEIIVNDTGSHDSTVIIAKSLPRVKVIENEWIDFSTARNQSIEAATGDWILWIDADDIVPLKSCEDIIKLKQSPLDRCFQFIIKGTMSGIPVGSQFKQLRMFPNLSEIRFEKPIHEQVIYSIRKLGLKELTVPVDIWHTGYEDKDECKRKARRNNEIMVKTGYGKTTYERFLLGKNYYILEEWYNGIHQFAHVVTDEKKDATLIKKSIILIGQGYFRLKQYEKALKYFDNQAADDIEAMYQKGQTLQEMHSLDAALECYIKCINFPEIVYTQASDYHFCKMHSIHLSWHILMAKNEKEKALQMMKLLQDQYPNFLINRGDYVIR